MRQGKDATLDIGAKTHHVVDKLVKTAMMETTRTGGTPVDAIYVGVMAALACAMTTAAILAKKPDWITRMSDTERENLNSSDLAKVAASLTNTETVTFAALCAAHTLEAFDEDGQVHTGFGPAELWQALQAWSKIFPDRLADNYLDPGMLEAARKAGQRINEPFDAFLAGRITNRNSPDSLN
jgi:hypothetical protein